MQRLQTCTLWLTSVGVDEMEVYLDDRLVTDAAPEAAKAYCKITMDDQVITIFNHDQLTKLKAIIDFILANWRGSDVET